MVMMKPRVLGYACSHAVRLSITNGICPETPVALTFLAVELNMQHKLLDACKCADVALRLLERFKKKVG
jgi:hypothetical protein